LVYFNQATTLNLSLLVHERPIGTASKLVSSLITRLPGKVAYGPLDHAVNTSCGLDGDVRGADGPAARLTEVSAEARCQSARVLPFRFAFFCS
jgi:hypothetical protein